MKRSMAFEGAVITLLILLAFLMLAMVLGNSGARGVAGSGDIRYAFAGCDDTLYVISGEEVFAVGEDGALKWSFRMPERWSVCDYGRYAGRAFSDGEPIVATGAPIAASDAGVLYVYVKPAVGGQRTYSMDGALMAISDGKELWELPIACHKAYAPAPGSRDGYIEYGDAIVHAGGGRAYVFHGHSETVIDGDGDVLWSIGNVSAPVAVDEQGFVYAARSPGPQGTVAAYYPNGTLYWERQVENPLLPDEYVSGGLPIYDKGTVYAPMYNGITALYRNGTVRWSKTFTEKDFNVTWPFDVNNMTDDQKRGLEAYKLIVTAYDTGPGIDVNGARVRLRLYRDMPFDREGNVYLQYTTDAWIPGSSSPLLSLLTIGPGGNETSRRYIYGFAYLAAKDGVGYATESVIRHADGRNYLIPGAGYVPRNVTDLAPDRLIAYDVGSGRELWNYSFAVGAPAVVTLDRDNVYGLLGRYLADDAVKNSGVNVSERWHYSPGPIQSREGVQVVPGDNVTYACFQSLNYESPAVLGESRCAYAGGIYAFDKNGTLLWQSPTPPIVANTMYVAPNGTVFYRTPDGKVGVTGAGVAAGFTLTTLLCLFLRFFLAGSVARAKARLSKNDNRNRVLEYITRNPGTSLYEIARGTGVNLGTARYHLLILGLNHKVVASQTDGKYVRYFTNSGTYGKEEQLALSLVRRGAMGRVLGVMLERPGISNAGIARELNIKESVVSRCVKELSERGIVARDPEKGCSVEEAYRGHVLMALRRLQGE